MDSQNSSWSHKNTLSIYFYEESSSDYVRIVRFPNYVNIDLEPPEQLLLR